MIEIEFENGSVIKSVDSNDSQISKRGRYQLERKFDYTLKGNMRISQQGTPANFSCVHCEKPHAYYDFKSKEMICTGCHYIEALKGKEVECGRCGVMYTKFTWFDPDCCPNCRKSFVD